jgi:hypothetical protein
VEPPEPVGENDGILLPPEAISAAEAILGPWVEAKDGETLPHDPTDQSTLEARDRHRHLARRASEGRHLLQERGDAPFSVRDDL